MRVQFSTGSSCVAVNIGLIVAVLSTSLLLLLLGLPSHTGTTFSSVDASLAQPQIQRQRKLQNNKRNLKSSKGGGGKGGGGKGGSGKGGGDVDVVYDAVVVGSGLAGLTAATELEKKGMNVKVLEAMERVGGRMFSIDLSKTQSIDFGGQWIGRTHDKLSNLVNELGLKVYLTPAETEDPKVGFTVIFKDERFSFLNAINTTDFISCSNAYQEHFDSILSELPRKVYPYEVNDTNENLLEIDDITSNEFINRHTSGDTVGRFVCKIMLGPDQSGWGPAESSTVSMLANIFSLINSPTNFEQPEYELIEGGAGQIPPILAGNLEHPVALGDPVVGITQKQMSSPNTSNHGQAGQIIATVQTLAGKEYKTKNVVVATSPYISGRIQYKPSLSWDRHQLNQHQPMGTTVKILAEYPEKFWKGAGLFNTSPDDGFLAICMDSTDIRNKDTFLLVCLTGGKQYDEFAAYDTLQKRKDAVLSELKLKYGDDRALSPKSFNIGDWPANPYIQGAYGSYWPPQVWTRFGHALLKPEGVIQWCSTDYAREWSGYFEGAIESGQVAARNVIEGNTLPLVPKIPSGDYAESEL